MTDLTRRNVLTVGLAVPAASLLANVTGAAGAPSQGDPSLKHEETVTAVSPRE